MDGPSCKCGLKKFCFCCLVWTADLWWCLPPVTPEAPDWWMLRGHPGTWDRKEFRKLKGENEFWASSPVATNRQKSMLQIFDFILLIIISLGHQQHYFDFSMPEKWHIILFYLDVSFAQQWFRFSALFNRHFFQWYMIPWACFQFDMFGSTEKETVECWVCYIVTLEGTMLGRVTVRSPATGNAIRGPSSTIG